MTDNNQVSPRDVPDEVMKDAKEEEEEKRCMDVDEGY